MENDKHEVALWAGAVAFFSSLLAVGIFDVFQPDMWVEYIGALIVALVTGGSVYAKQRYDDAKKAEGDTNDVALTTYAKQPPKAPPKSAPPLPKKTPPKKGA